MEIEMFGFDVEEDDLKKDKEFEGSICEKLGYSKYLCPNPNCGAHLKESMGELICLNACHLPSHWQKRFSKQMAEISKKQK